MKERPHASGGCSSPIPRIRVLANPTVSHAELVGDAGAYASLSTKVLKRATTHATGPYDIAHAKVDCYAMFTNNPPSGAFRGFGVTQSAFAVESNMDIVAQELNMDPLELRPAMDMGQIHFLARSNGETRMYVQIGDELHKGRL